MAASLTALIVLAIGGYMLNWSWTGFKGNTLWDWLHLLVLPVVLTLTTLWILQHHSWRRSYTLALVISGLAMAILAIGGYMLNWSWTGFKGNTFWDWLNLLLLPVVLTVVTAWFSASSTSEKGALGASLNQRLIQEDLAEVSVAHE